MSNGSALREKLKEMAQLSILANRISEVQEKNLKTYPFVFFNDVKSVKIDYDLAPRWSEDSTAENQKQTESRVSYYLELSESSNTMLDKRFLCIEEAVRALFWKDVRVQVYFNGKKSYESKDV